MQAKANFIKQRGLFYSHTKRERERKPPKHARKGTSESREGQIHHPSLNANPYNRKLITTHPIQASGEE